MHDWNRCTPIITYDTLHTPTLLDLYYFSEISATGTTSLFVRASLRALSPAPTYPHNPPRLMYLSAQIASHRLPMKGAGAVERGYGAVARCWALLFRRWEQTACVHRQALSLASSYLRVKASISVYRVSFGANPPPVDVKRRPAYM